MIWIDYPTLLDDLRVGDRLIIGDGAISLRVVADRARRGRGADRDRRAHPGSTRRAPAVRTDATCHADRRGPRARRPGGGGRRRLHRRVVRARRGRHPRRRRRGRRPGRSSSPRSRPPRRSPTSARSSTSPTPIMVARGDLGIDCPLEDVPAPPEDDHRALRRVRRAGDHRHPDARVDGDRAVADARRGDRRRQRHLRRHGRADAVGRDGDRPRPGAGRGDDGPHRRARRARGPLPRLGGPPRPHPARALGLDQRPDHGRPDARRLAGGRRRRRHRDPVLHVARSHRQGDGAVPARGAAVGAVAQPAHTERARRCRGASSR